MTGLCYLVTTLQQTYEIYGKNIMFGFTPFRRREDAIAGVDILKTSEANPIPLVGRLELDDEAAELPTQVNPDLLVQLGYRPDTSQKDAADYRLELRRRGLKRISVVSWNEMQEEIAKKEEYVKRLLRGCQQIRDYDSDHQSQYEKIVADEQEKSEAIGLGRNFMDILKSYEDMRATHGFTRRDQEISEKAQLVCLSFFGEIYRSEARYYAELTQKAVTSEAKKMHAEKAIDCFNRYQLIMQQIKARTEKQLRDHGLGTGSTIIELGREDLARLGSGELSLTQMESQQAALDAQRGVKQGMPTIEALLMRALMEQMGSEHFIDANRGIIELP